MAGIQETKEVLNFILSLGNAIGKSLEDGKFSYTDLMYFFGAMQAAPDAVKGIEKVPSELKDLSKEEVEELRRFVISKFDIPQKDVEERIEKALATALGLIEVVQSFMRS